MRLQYPLVDIDNIEPQNLSKLFPGSTFEARLTIGGGEGSSSMAIHELYRPGEGHGRVTFHDCDQLIYYLSGGGIAGINDQNTKVKAGHCMHIPKGSEYSFYNTGDDKATIIKFIIGATDFSKVGYEFAREQTYDETVPLVAELNQGTLVHLDDIKPESMDRGDGWLISDFRLPIAGHSGSASTMFRARFLPGAVHKKHCHQNCEEIYYLISGRGLAGAGEDRVQVHAGQFHYIPKGVEHWLHNLSDTDAIEVVGVYINAASVAETGYTYLGEVSPEDLQLGSAN